jgi:hypothetical protein
VLIVSMGDFQLAGLALSSSRLQALLLPVGECQAVAIDANAVALLLWQLLLRCWRLLLL